MRRQLVLVHGFAGGPSSWDEVVREMRALAAARPSITVAAAGPEALQPMRHTLPGHLGRAPCPFDEAARQLGLVVQEAAMRGPEPTPVHLVGYSLGGRVALGAAIRLQTEDRIGLLGSLTLIGVNPGLSDVGEREARCRWDDAWAERIASAACAPEGMSTFADAWSRLPIFESQRTADDTLLQHQRALRSSHDPHGLSAAMRLLGLGRMPNLWPGLSGLSCDIYVGAGELDSKYLQLAHESAALSADTRGRTARSVVLRFRGCGHNPLLEAPDQVAEHLVMLCGEAAAK